MSPVSQGFVSFDLSISCITNKNVIVPGISITIVILEMLISSKFWFIKIAVG